MFYSVIPCVQLLAVGSSLPVYVGLSSCLIVATCIVLIVFKNIHDMWQYWHRLTVVHWFITWLLVILHLILMHYLTLFVYLFAQNTHIRQWRI